jgi:PAS domain S-box-containing protein
MTACLRLAQAIGRTRTVEEIYAVALDALEEALGVSRSSILLYDPDGVMRFKAYRRLSDEYRRAVEGHTPWTPETHDPETVVVADVSQESSLAPLRDTIQVEGIAAMAFVPLVSFGRPIGKFMLYFPEPHVFDASELQLAELIAAQVAFAVERTRAEEQVRQSETKLRFALHAANMGTWDWDVDTHALHWSDNLEAVHGLPPGTFDQTFESYEREIHPDDRGRVLHSIRKALDDGTPHDIEYRIVAPDGTVRWVEGKGRVERDFHGRPIRMSGVCMNVTSRKQMEFARLEALEMAHRASHRLAAIVESSGDAIVSKTLDGIVTSWNRAAERLFGHSAAEVIGRSITIIIPPERLSEEPVLLARIRAGEAVEMETIRQRKDGTRVPISLMVSPIRDADGRIVGASKIARDITERKRAESERAELHRRLATLVEASATLLNSPDTQSVVDATMRIAHELLVADGYAIWTSERGTKWRVSQSAGVSVQFASRVIEARGAAPSDPLLPISRAWAVPDVTTQPLLAGEGDAYRDEGIRSMLVCPMRLGADRAATLVFYYRTPRDFTGADIETGQTLANLAAAAMTTADLYDQLRVERNALEAARGRAAFLADTTAVLSGSLDYEKTLAAVARMAVPEIADWCAVDLLGTEGELQRVAAAHVDPAKIEHARELHARYPSQAGTPGGVHEVVRTGKAAMMTSIPPELVAAHAETSEHARLLAELALTSYMCVPLLSANGPLGAITFAYAESGRHYTDRDLAFTQELAARATLAIENAVAYRRANEANRVKDEFLATLSHELRTPLNAILGYAQMLNTGVLAGQRYANGMTVMMRNAHVLKQIIDDVLDVARITSGKLRLNVRPIELGDIVANAVATIRPAADGKGLTVDVTPDPAGTFVLGDPDRLQQIVWNLLSNAVKFTPSGGWVRVRQRQVDSAVELTVADSGQGIDPAFLPYIFERFRQADSRFSRDHGGLGLGLSIVRELTELHGGTVSAVSGGRGAGATFTVRLPVLASQGVLADQGAREIGAQLMQPAPTNLRGVRILAVDNEEDALGLLRLVLESSGAEVTTAASAESALSALQAAPFDAVVADIGMPGTDGLQLIRNIRQTLPKPTNRIPAAALTAYARSEDRVAALASGFQMHLAKPINPSELVSALATLLGRI